MKTLSGFIVTLMVMVTSVIHAYDEDFWVKTTESGDVQMRYVVNLAATPNGRIFAATAAGLWKSDNRGGTWTHVPVSNHGLISGTQVLRDGTIMAGGRDSLHFSYDGGESWKTFTFLEHEIPQIDYYRFVEKEDGSLFCAMNSGYSGLFVPLGIWESHDRGKSWSLVCAETETSSESTCIALHPGGDVFWGSWGWQGLFVQRAATGECHNIYAPGGFGESEWDPISMAINSRGQIMVGTDRPESAIFTSLDTGNSWKKYDHWRKHAPFGRIHTITVDRHDNFVVSALDTVWFTDDLAESWTKIPGYLDEFEYIYSLCLDSSDYLYVGTQNGHIYRSRSPLYAATDVYSRTSTIERFTLSPNPTSGELTVSYSLERPGIVTAELVDMRGTVVKHLQAVRKPVGRHVERVNLGAIPAGVYVLSLQIDDRTEHQLCRLID